MLNKTTLIRLAAFFSTAVLCSTSLSQTADIEWMVGPRSVDIGDDLAEIYLDSGYAFANGDDSRKIMIELGNPPSGDEVGIIVPDSEDVGWLLLFEYLEVGYVRDDDKDQLDADAILQSITAGTLEANKERARMGVAPLYILGWYEPPHYDELSHNLVWAILGESEGDTVVNYNTRLLGREGYMSAVLITGPNGLDVFKKEVEAVMSSFSYKSGQRYAEFKEGDKVAKYGLTALIAGGAGAVAAKTGLLAILGKFIAKLGKLLIIVVVGILAFLKKIATKIWRVIRGEDASPTATPGPR